MLSCVFNPGACLSQTVDGFISLFPFGIVGFAFVAGMIVGAVLGKIGVGALIALAAVIKFGQVNVAHPDNPTQPTKRALTAEEVRKLQAALNALGFNAGAVDGKPGRQTREAIQQFQVSREEIVTGTPTADQLKALKVWR